MISRNESLSDREKETCAVYAMRMALEDFSVQNAVAYEDALRAFTRSKTYGDLFDFETALWREGPDYIRHLFEQELDR